MTVGAASYWGCIARAGASVDLQVLNRLAAALGQAFLPLVLFFLDAQVTRLSPEEIPHDLFRRQLRTFTAKAEPRVSGCQALPVTSLLECPRIAQILRRNASVSRYALGQT